MKKVVLLGDSIRLIGYGTKVPELLKDCAEVWQYEGNCMFSNFTYRVLYDHRNSIENADVIHWNNGLWDVSRLFNDETFNTLEDYVTNMKRIAKILLTFGKKVIFATTTPVPPENNMVKNSDILAYNAAVVPELKAMGIIINDLYSVVDADIDKYIRHDDHIHLSDEGIDVCAEHVANFIKEHL